MENTGYSWSKSLSTRRSIPLVCRQWHDVGLRFLYEHIVLHEASQVYQLVTLLQYLHSKGQERLDWIRGVELVAGPMTAEQAYDFWTYTLSLLEILSRDKLRFLAIDPLEYPNARTRRKAAYAIRHALCHFDTSLEVFHFSISHESLRFSDIMDTRAPEQEGMPHFPNLHTLSTTKARWHLPDPSMEQIIAPFRMLRGQVPQLRTISFEWAQPPAEIFQFLRAVPQLESAYIGSKYSNHLIALEFDKFLNLTPCLKHLTIRIQHGSHIRRHLPPSICHPNIEEIVFLMNFPTSYKSIAQLETVFEKIKREQLTGLRRVVLYGPFHQGCVDAAVVLPSHVITSWHSAIEICAKHDVQLINSRGYPMHIWATRHGIKVNGIGLSRRREAPEQEDETEQGSENESEAESTGQSEDEEEWYETDNESYFNGSSTEEEISNDSEDASYRYVHQADVDLVEFESGSGVGLEV